MKKLTNTAKKLDVLAKVLFWLCAICGGASVVIAIAIALFGGSLMADATASVTLGPVTLGIDEAPSVDVLRTQFLAGSVLMTVAITVTCIGISYIRSILKPMKEGRPFDGSVHRNMKKLAWLSLIGGGVMSVIGAACQAFMISSYDIQSLFTDAVTSMNVEIKLDLTFIIVFAVIYLLAYVFQYGEQLQTEADETL